VESFRARREQGDALPAKEAEPTESVEDVWTPAAQMVHYESLTFGAPDSPRRLGQYDRDIDTMRGRWGELLDHDPCYNPNLSLDPKRQFQLAAPPRTAFGLSDFGGPEPDRAISRTCTSALLRSVEDEAV